MRAGHHVFEWEKYWYSINVYTIISAFRREIQSVIGKRLRKTLVLFSHGKHFFDKMLIISSGRSTSSFPSFRMGRDIFAPSRKYLTPNLQLFTPKQYFFFCLIFKTRVSMSWTSGSNTAILKITLTPLTWEANNRFAFYQEEFTDFLFTNVDLHNKQ